MSQAERSIRFMLWNWRDNRRPVTLAPCPSGPVSCGLPAPRRDAAALAWREGERPGVALGPAVDPLAPAGPAFTDGEGLEALDGVGAGLSPADVAFILDVPLLALLDLLAEAGAVL